MARASDGAASSADLGWRSKDLTEFTIEHSTLDAGAGKDFVPTAIVHRVIRTLSTTLYRFVRKVKAGRFVRSVLKRGNREPGITFRKEIACGKNQK